MNKELLQSMNELATGFVMENMFTNNRLLHVDENLGLILATVKNRPAIVVIKAVMYPYNMNLSDKGDEYVEYLEGVWQGSDTIKSVDMYFLGAGLVQRHVDEDQKGVYEIGKKYGVALGCLTLLKKNEEENLGYCYKNPVMLEDVSAEYSFMKSLVTEEGYEVIWERYGGSFSFPDYPNILDCWKVEWFNPDLDLNECVYIYTDGDCDGPWRMFDESFVGWQYPAGFRRA